MKNKNTRALKSHNTFYMKYDPYFINILPKMQFKP